MKALSPSATRVCEAAIGHFAAQGYDASSLNEIALLAGMRKASLYAHFANKAALYTAAFERALATEAAFVEQAFREEAAGKVAPGHWLVLNLGERYQRSQSLKLVLRTAFLPPADVKDVVTARFEQHLENIREDFGESLRGRFEWARRDAALTDVYADAYLGIMDSLHVELMYADLQVYTRRAASLLKILDDSLSLNR